MAAIWPGKRAVTKVPPPTKMEVAEERGTMLTAVLVIIAAPSA